MTLEAALLVGHLVGDWIVQTDGMARTKTAPDATGWLAMAAHVLSYHAALLAVLLLTGHTDPTALIATMAVSAATHAVIDRRWPVRRLLAATGSAQFAQQEWGVLVVDQVLHITILLACVGLWP